MRQSTEFEARRFCRFVFFNLIACVIAYLLLISHELTNTIDGMWSGADYRNYEWVIQIGRWFWPLVGTSQMNVCPEPFTSVFALSMYVVGSCVAAWWFGLKDSLKGYLLVLTSLVTTAVCSTLTFRYTSPTFGMAYMLSVLAAWAVSRENWKTCLVSITCLVLALALYQSNIGCACVLALLYIIRQLQDDDDDKRVIRYFFRFAVSLLCSFVVYKIIWDLTLNLCHIQAVDYRGADSVTVGKIITGFPKSFLSTYQEFFRYFFRNELKHIIYQRLTAFRILLLVLFAVNVILGARKLAGKPKRRWLLAAVCLLLIPPAANIALILAVDAGEATIQMTMPIATVFPFLLCVTDVGECRNRLIKTVDWLRIGIVLVTLYGSFLMVSVDQHVMLKSRDNATAMMNRVAADLGEDQNPEGGFVFVGKIADNPNFLRDQLWDRANQYARYGDFHIFVLWDNRANFSYFGLLRDSGLNLTFNWDNVYWGDMIRREEVQEMPLYPEDGYIKKIGNTIVVKFADIEEKES